MRDGYTEVTREVENSFWYYCNKCDKFYFHTAYLTGKFNWFRDYPHCSCGARLISCTWLLHMNDKYKKLAEINCKSLDKLTKLCRTCKQRFRCWSERF